ncbi:MAG TPA: SxtJ family membrane protein [Leadbetterella sp.]|jgi:dolichyl-phosphate-mannose--protein O-mannosyl transferase|nr:SxtJ family membrane protein [Leadbetterella sp.]
MKIADRYQSLLVIVVGFLVLYFIFQKNYDWYFFEFKRNYFLYAAVAIGVSSLMFDSVADIILKGWMKIAEVLGFINTRILMSLVFFIFLTPFALLQRVLSRKNFLSLKDSDSTVFHTRDHEYKPEDFDNIW